MSDGMMGYWIGAYRDNAWLWTKYQASALSWAPGSWR